jgi:hypothetical protein
MNSDTDKSKQSLIHDVMPRFLCAECGWIGEQKEMKHEYDFGYDQSCCPKCNDVMMDNLHGNMYCEKVLQNEA